MEAGRNAPPPVYRPSMFLMPSFIFIFASSRCFFSGDISLLKAALAFCKQNVTPPSRFSSFDVPYPLLFIASRVHAGLRSARGLWPRDTWTRRSTGNARQAGHARDARGCGGHDGRHADAAERPGADGHRSLQGMVHGPALSCHFARESSREGGVGSL